MIGYGVNTNTCLNVKNSWTGNSNYSISCSCSISNNGNDDWYRIANKDNLIEARRDVGNLKCTSGKAIIRYERDDPSPIDKPTGLTLEYNGQVQTGVILGEGYELTNNTGKDVGQYIATATLKDGYIWSGDNSMEDAKVEWSITPKTLTVTPEENQSKIFGEADSVLKYTYSGVATGEIPKFLGDLSRESGEWAGEYEINGGNLQLVDNTDEGFLSQNYSLKVEKGKFKIEYGPGTFITKWNVSSDEDIKLPIPKNVNNSYIVDWGDRTYNRYTEEAFPTHRYADNSERTIAIAGIMKEFGHCQDAIPNLTNMYRDYFSQTEHIIEIIQWGVVGATKYGFAHCGNLTGNIPSPESESFKELTSGAFMFKDCSNLSGGIPTEFFKDANNTEEFKATFAGCTGLTGEIPGNLFNGCIKAGDFSETFNGCTGLTGIIPEGLFSSCLGAKNFNATFAGCTGLNGAIPEGLFSSCSGATEFYSTFAGCAGLNGAIPEGLFSSCTNANVFRETFANCSNLTSDSTGAVAKNLFVNNKNANNFYRTFYGCTNLSGNLNIVLPSLNFDINKEITGNYTSMFEGCTGIEKVILSNIKIGYKMFKDCTGIKELVLSNTEAICGEAFSGCIYLTNINVNDDNLKEIIQGAFYIAGDIITKSIASVPDKLLTSINRESQTLMAYDWLTDNRLVDLDAPKGTVTISQYPFTSSHSLDITIAVVDNYSNEDKCKMAIVLGENYSESLNVESLTWQDYSSTSQIKLQNITEGIKTVWVFFKDEVGNISRIKKEI